MRFIRRWRRHRYGSSSMVSGSLHCRHESVGRRSFQDHVSCH